MVSKIGFNTLFIEKNGVSDILARYAEDKGIAILNSRGSATEHIYDLLKLVHKFGSDTFLLTNIINAILYIAKRAA